VLKPLWTLSIEDVVGSSPTLLPTTIGAGTGEVAAAGDAAVVPPAAGRGSLRGSPPPVSTPRPPLHTLYGEGRGGAAAAAHSGSQVDQGAGRGRGGTKQNATPPPVRRHRRCRCRPPLGPSWGVPKAVHSGAPPPASVARGVREGCAPHSHFWRLHRRRVKVERSSGGCGG